METKKSFTERWAGKFVPAKRDDARYDALAKKRLEDPGFDRGDETPTKK